MMIRPLIKELLTQDALFKGMTRVMQENEIGGVIHFNIDTSKISKFVMIRNNGNGAFACLQYFNAHFGGVRQKCATPTPGAEGGNWR